MTTCPDDSALQPGLARILPLKISVVVPIRNEARHIRQTLTQLVSQEYAHDDYEILVVDGDSTDGTPEIVNEFTAKYPNVQLFHNPRRWSSAARNIGVRHAHGDVILVVDGHCELEDDRLLTKVANAFAESGADCIGRPQPLDVAHATLLQRAIAAARSSWLGHQPDSHVFSSTPRFVPAQTVAVAYRREVFARAGEFDERFDACEDLEFNHRVDLAGLRCYFTPQAAVRYLPRSSLRGLFRQLVRYGRGRVRMWRKHPDTFSLGTWIPALFVAGLVVGLPLACWSNWLGLLYWSTLGLYAAIVLGMSTVIAARTRELAFLFLLPAVYLTIHASSGVGLIREFVSPGFRPVP